MDFCYPRNRSVRRSNRIPKKVEKYVSQSDKNMSSKKSKYKTILGLKKPIIVLEDCFFQKNILNDVSLMHNIPLQYRIANNKLRKSYNKKDYVDKCPKDHLFKHSISINRSIDFFKERSLNAINKKNSNSSKGNNDKIQKALKITKDLDDCLDKISLCDNNKSQILSTKNLLENPQNDYELKVSFHVEDTRNKCFLPDKQNLISERQRSNSLLKENDQKYTSKTELQIVDENLNNVTDKSIKINNLIILKNNISNNLLLENCKSAVVIKNHYRNIVRKRVFKSAKEGREEKNNIIHVTNKNLYKNIDLLSQKRTNSGQDTDNRTMKKIKLDTVHQLPNYRSELNANQVLSQDIILNTGELNTVARTDENVVIQATNVQLNNKNNISSTSVENNQIVKDINKKDDNFQQNVKECLLAIGHKPSAENHTFLSSTAKSNEKEIVDEENNSDYISLFADSSLLAEYDAYVSNNSSRSEMLFRMTEDVFDTYYKNTTSDFNLMYNINKNNVLEKITKLSNSEEIAAVAEKNDIPKNSNFRYKHISRIRKPKIISKNYILRFVFRGYCYVFIDKGYCYKKKCFYNHNFLSHMIEYYEKDEQYFFSILNTLAMTRCTRFIQQFYQSLIYHHDVNCVLKVFKKLSELKIINNTTVFSIIENMQSNGYTIKLITNKLAGIVTSDDFIFVNWILKKLEKYIVHGQYWITFKDLLLSTEKLDLEIVETILRECTITKSHIEDININIMSNLCNEIYSQIDEKLLSSFKSLIVHKKTSSEIEEKAISQFYREINSPDSYLAKDKSNNEEDIIQKRNKTNDSKDIQSENSSFPLHRTDNVPEPHSVYGKEKFRKFYVYVNGLQEGLKHNDYNHIMNILNSVQKHQQSFFTRACYKILCNEIKYSQYHLTKLISHSVQIGTTAISYQILLNVSKCILAELAGKNLWVFAYILLKDINLLLQPQIHLHQFDAATVMLFVEIYLANQQAVKAYTLLKQTNIIYTDRRKWNVHSTVKDSSTRAQIITILLNALCEIFLEYALFLFEFLIIDQYSNFYPVDLTNFANKIIPLLLLKEDHDLIISITKLIVKYNVVLKVVTYRALIAKLVHIDVTLAKHLYQTAINLGVYSRVQFHPTMYLIINCDWTKEEMYLAILDLMEQLSSNIGHALDHINPRKFSIYLIFENILSNKKPIYKKETNQQYDIKIEESKIVMKTVLQNQFNPCILIINDSTDRICKLSSVSILQYLRCKHCI